MGHHSDPILARTAPADLTIADCVDGWFRVTVWCADMRCGGRDIELSRLAAVSDRKLLDLMREGFFTCKKCKKFGETVGVSSSEHADRILFWKLGDECGLAGMPS